MLRPFKWCRVLSLAHRGVPRPFDLSPHKNRGGEFLMLRRAVLILATMALAVVALSGVALAVNKVGTFRPDTLIGTNQVDRIYGLGAADRIAARAGNDDCYGGSGADTIFCGDGNDRIDGGFGEDELYGQAGNDTISAADGQRDLVNCGAGVDTAYVDELDDFAANCENLFVAQQPRV